MITKEDVLIYFEYRGWYDGYMLKSSKGKKKVSSDKVWFDLDVFFQDIFLVRTGKASVEFSNALEKMLTLECENLETRELICSLETQLMDNKK